MSSDAPFYKPSVLITARPDELVSQLAEYAAAGATRVVVTVAAGDWFRQTELLAEALRA